VFACLCVSVSLVSVSMCGPGADPAIHAMPPMSDMPPHIPPHMPPPPTAWYILVMMAMAMPSTLFCCASYSSLSALGLASSHCSASSHMPSMALMSSPSTLSLTSSSLSHLLSDKLYFSRPFFASILSRWRESSSL